MKGYFQGKARSQVCIDKDEGLGGSFLWTICSGIALAVETGLSYSLI